MAQVVNKRNLNPSDLQAIGQLLVEILGGEVSPGSPHLPKALFALIRAAARRDGVHKRCSLAR